ncbi:hypothetical protein CBR_g52559 [Chara braunii]|uniref:Uncharacterized protein n=1 Tax=Chara braunii TaxID=69332 RepID=A0A388MAI4_CHABU|nr:hypothetical protein CBR_g52559 [Chara braunii]|eukprot:GBG91525.1 hypothetical protein CBR_g52559 [Chara braunii]
MLAIVMPRGAFHAGKHAINRRLRTLTIEKLARREVDVVTLHSTWRPNNRGSAMASAASVLVAGRPRSNLTPVIKQIEALEVNMRQIQALLDVQTEGTEGNGDRLSIDPFGADVGRGNQESLAGTNHVPVSEGVGEGEMTPAGTVLPCIGAAALVSLTVATMEDRLERQLTESVTRIETQCMSRVIEVVAAVSADLTSRVDEAVSRAREEGEARAAKLKEQNEDLARKMEVLEMEVQSEKRSRVFLQRMITALAEALATSEQKASQCSNYVLAREFGDSNAFPRNPPPSPALSFTSKLKTARSAGMVSPLPPAAPLMDQYLGVLRELSAGGRHGEAGDAGLYGGGESAASPVSVRSAPLERSPQMVESSASRRAPWSSKLKSRFGRVVDLQAFTRGDAASVGERARPGGGESEAELPCVPDVKLPADMADGVSSRLSERLGLSDLAQGSPYSDENAFVPGRGLDAEVPELFKKVGRELLLQGIGPAGAGSSREERRPCSGHTHPAVEEKMFGVESGDCKGADAAEMTSLLPEQPLFSYDVRQPGGPISSYHPVGASEDGGCKAAELQEDGVCAGSPCRREEARAAAEAGAPLPFLAMSINLDPDSRRPRKCDSRRGLSSLNTNNNNSSSSSSSYGDIYVRPDVSYGSSPSGSTSSLLKKTELLPTTPDAWGAPHRPPLQALPFPPCGADEYVFVEGGTPPRSHSRSRIAAADRPAPSCPAAVSESATYTARCRALGGGYERRAEVEGCLRDFDRERLTKDLSASMERECAALQRCREGNEEECTPEAAGMLSAEGMSLSLSDVSKFNHCPDSVDARSPISVIGEDIRSYFQQSASAEKKSSGGMFPADEVDPEAYPEGFLDVAEALILNAQAGPTSQHALRLLVSLLNSEEKKSTALCETEGVGCKRGTLQSWYPMLNIPVSPCFSTSKPLAAKKSVSRALALAKNASAPQWQRPEPEHSLASSFSSAKENRPPEEERPSSDNKPPMTLYAGERTCSSKIRCRLNVDHQPQHPQQQEQQEQGVLREEKLPSPPCTPSMSSAKDENDTLCNFADENLPTNFATVVPRGGEAGRARLAANVAHSGNGYELQARVPASDLNALFDSPALSTTSSSFLSGKENIAPEAAVDVEHTSCFRGHDHVAVANQPVRDTASSPPPLSSLPMVQLSGVLQPMDIHYSCALVSRHAPRSSAAGANAEGGAEEDTPVPSPPPVSAENMEAVAVDQLKSTIVPSSEEHVLAADPSSAFLFLHDAHDVAAFDQPTPKLPFSTACSPLLSCLEVATAGAGAATARGERAVLALDGTPMCEQQEGIVLTPSAKVAADSKIECASASDGVAPAGIVGRTAEAVFSSCGEAQEFAAELEISSVHPAEHVEATHSREGDTSAAPSPAAVDSAVVLYTADQQGGSSQLSFRDCNIANERGDTELAGGVSASSPSKAPASDGESSSGPTVCRCSSGRTLIPTSQSNGTRVSTHDLEAVYQGFASVSSTVLVNAAPRRENGAARKNAAGVLSPSSETPQSTLRKLHHHVGNGGSDSEGGGTRSVASAAMEASAEASESLKQQQQQQQHTATVPPQATEAAVVEVNEGGHADVCLPPVTTSSRAMPSTEFVVSVERPCPDSYCMGETGEVEISSSLGSPRASLSLSAALRLGRLLTPSTEDSMSEKSRSVTVDNAALGGSAGHDDFVDDAITSGWTMHVDEYLREARIESDDDTVVIMGKDHGIAHRDADNSEDDHDGGQADEDEENEQANLVLTSTKKRNNGLQDREEGWADGGESDEYRRLAYPWGQQQQQKQSRPSSPLKDSVVDRKGGWSECGTDVIAERSLDQVESVKRAVKEHPGTTIVGSCNRSGHAHDLDGHDSVGETEEQGYAPPGQSVTPILDRDCMGVDGHFWTGLSPVVDLSDLSREEDRQSGFNSSNKFATLALKGSVGKLDENEPSRRLKDIAVTSLEDDIRSRLGDDDIKGSWTLERGRAVAAELATSCPESPRGEQGLSHKALLKGTPKRKEEPLGPVGIWLKDKLKLTVKRLEALESAIRRDDAEAVAELQRVIIARGGSTEVSLLWQADKSERISQLMSHCIRYCLAVLCEQGKDPNGENRSLDLCSDDQVVLVDRALRFREIIHCQAIGKAAKLAQEGLQREGLLKVGNVKSKTSVSSDGSLGGRSASSFARPLARKGHPSVSMAGGSAGSRNPTRRTGKDSSSFERANGVGKSAWGGPGVGVRKMPAHKTSTKATELSDAILAGNRPVTTAARKISDKENQGPRSAAVATSRRIHKSDGPVTAPLSPLELARTRSGV